FIDSIRHESHDIDLLIGAAIVYVAVNDKARDGHEPQIPTSTLWPAIRERPDRELGAALRQAAEDIERHRPVLSETITRGLAAARELSGTSLRRLIDLVDSATSPRDGTLAAG